MNKTALHAAVIDIGSNSIRFMHASVTPQGVTAFLPKQLATTRLAEGLVETGELSGDAMARSLRAIAHYVAISREIGVNKLYAYATSAVRDAKNRDAFLQAVHATTGLRVDVLCGKEEAKLAYIGAVGQTGGGLIDIGGGSTQIMTKDAGYSFPLGCVRAKDLFAHMPFADMLLVIDDWFSCRLPALCANRWTGVGGTITTLGALHAGLHAYDSAIVSNQILTPLDIHALCDDLCALGGERSAHPLLEQRHDVILFGTAILLALMRALRIAFIQVSDADGMEGYLASQANI